MLPCLQRTLISPATSPLLPCLHVCLQLHAEASDLAPLTATLQRHLSRVTLSRGQVLFSAGDPMDSIYLVEAGHLRLEAASPASKAGDQGPGWLGFSVGGGQGGETAGEASGRSPAATTAAAAAVAEEAGLHQG